MKIKYRKKFLKELSRVPATTRVKIEQFVFNDIFAIGNIFLQGNIEKMSGYHGYYKIRFGPYRVGLKMEDDTIIFERVLHRKDIYRYFPET